MGGYNTADSVLRDGKTKYVIKIKFDRCLFIDFVCVCMVLCGSARTLRIFVRDLMNCWTSAIRCPSEM